MKNIQTQLKWRRWQFIEDILNIFRNNTTKAIIEKKTYK